MPEPTVERALDADDNDENVLQFKESGALNQALDFPEKLYNYIVEDKGFKATSQIKVEERLRKIITREEEFKLLIESSEGYFDTLIETKSMGAFLSTIVKICYNQFEDGGNKNASNERGSGMFRYERIVQLLAENANSIKKPRMISNPYKGIDEPAGIECYFASVIQIYKSLGLIRPDLSREDFEDEFTHIFDTDLAYERRKPSNPHYKIPSKFNYSMRGREDIPKGERQMNIRNFLDIARGLQKTDWAGLTGMHNVKLKIKSIGNDKGALIKELREGNTVRLTYYKWIRSGGFVPYHHLTAGSYENGQIMIDDPLIPGKRITYDKLKGRYNITGRYKITDFWTIVPN